MENIIFLLYLVRLPSYFLWVTIYTYYNKYFSLNFISRSTMAWQQFSLPMTVNKICCEKCRWWSPLWSGGQSSWLQIQRSQVWFPALADWEVVGLERCPLSLMSTIEELLGRNGSGFGLKSQEHDNGDPLRWPHNTVYPQTLALSLLTGSGH
jgi:hypothetical protein